MKHRYPEIKGWLSHIPRTGGRKLQFSGYFVTVRNSSPTAESCSAFQKKVLEMETNITGEQA